MVFELLITEKAFFVKNIEEMGKRQNQVAEIVKRNFGILLQSEGGYIYGHEPLVTVTNVEMSPDMGLAKIYLSVYNTENKQAVLLLLREEQKMLRQGLGKRIRKHVRRIPDISFFLDDTLDEIFRVGALFKKLEDEGQMGKKEGKE